MKISFVLILRRKWGIKMDKWRIAKEGLKCCIDGNCKNCPFYNEIDNDFSNCTSKLAKHAYQVLDEMEEIIDRLGRGE